MRTQRRYWHMYSYSGYECKGVDQGRIEREHASARWLLRQCACTALAAHHTPRIRGLHRDCPHKQSGSEPQTLNHASGSEPQTLNHVSACACVHTHRHKEAHKEACIKKHTRGIHKEAHKRHTTGTALAARPSHAVHLLSRDRYADVNMMPACMPTNLRACTL